MTAPAGFTTREERIAALHQALRERILVLDGSWGVLIQGYGLQEADYRGERFKDWPQDLKGNNDLLILTRPDIISSIHRDYLEAGADITSTNTFTSTSIAQADYGLQAYAEELNREGARLGREVADEFTARDPSRPRWVAAACLACASRCAWRSTMPFLATTSATVGGRGPSSPRARSQVPTAVAIGCRGNAPRAPATSSGESAIKASKISTVPGRSTTRCRASTSSAVLVSAVSGSGEGALIRGSLSRASPANGHRGPRPRRC